MTYAISDIHGCYDKYLAMLERISLNGDDTLYVLGDVIDRGEGGVDLLLSMSETPEVIPLIGNHEALALPVMKAIRDGKPFEAVERSRAYLIWTGMGGAPTVSAFRKLGKTLQKKVVDYIESFTVYDEIEVGGKRFHLSHTLPGFDPGRGIHDVSYSEFVWGEPDYEIRYDRGVTFVTGHTPTDLIDPASKGRIWQKNGHIAIDCGAVFEGGRLGCICLDTMEEYYV